MAPQLTAMNGPPAAELVNEARRQLLAGTGFARHMHRCHAACHVGNGHAHRIDGRRRAQQLRAGAGHRCGGRGGTLATGRCIEGFEGRAHQRAQRIQSHRFVQIIEGTGLQGGHRIFGAGIGSDHRHRCVAPLGIDQPHQIQSIAVGQTHVGQAQRIAMVPEQCPGLGQIRGHVHIQPHALQGQFQQFAQAFLVIDHQHACRAGGRVACISRSGIHGCHSPKNRQVPDGLQAAPAGCPDSWRVSWTHSSSRWACTVRAPWAGVIRKPAP